LKKLVPMIKPGHLPSGRAQTEIDNGGPECRADIVGKMKGEKV
jgi:hypothetical protein